MTWFMMLDTKIRLPRPFLLSIQIFKNFAKNPCPAYVR